jgi:hypothetical protein
MNFSAPLRKQQKTKVVDGPLERFKTLKPVLSSKVGRDLVEKACSRDELFWIERWLENLVRSRGLPPQCMGADAYNALMKFLEPSEALKILETLRLEFRESHPQTQTLMEDFSFLLEELKASPVPQIPPPPYDHSSHSQPANPIVPSSNDREERLQELFRYLYRKNPQEPLP